MYLRFTSIELEGFMSLGKVSVDLSNQGNVIVKGINKYDDASSNGSGKSSIFEGIIWALTGSLSRGSVPVNDIINRNYKNYCLVTLRFNCNNDIIEVTRTRKHPQLGSSLILKVNEVDVSKKTASLTSKYLLEMIPQLTSVILSSVIILGQGLPNSFSSMSPSARKDYLESVTQLNSEITKIVQFYKTYLSEIDDQITQYVEERSSNRGQLGLLNSSIISYESTIDELSKKIEEIKNSDNNSKLEELQGRKQRLLGEYESQEISIKKYKDLSEEYKSYLQSLSSKIEITRSYKLQYEVDEICPTCGQRLPEDKIIECRNNALMLQNKIDELEKLQSEYTVKYNDALYEYKKYKVVQDTISYHLGQVNSELSELESLVDTTVLESDLSTYESLVSSAKDQFVLISKTVKSQTEKLDEVKSYRGKINKLSRSVNKEFKSFMLSDIILYLNEKLEYYSKFITPSSKVKIDQSTSKIEIYKDDSVYESLSGGERRRLDIIIQLSIRDMMSSITNFHCNLLVLDEIFDNLDKDGCDRLIKLLYTQFNEVDSLYVVTHRVDLELQGDQELSIVKNEMGVSELQSLGGLIC